MAITYDSAKNARNIRERGLSFDRAADFDFSTAVFHTEIRSGETRRIAVGYLGKRLHLLCYIPKPDGIRVISFRKTNNREAKRYGKAQTID
ncbi:MAG: BrnT family toxin [Terracidiphilus sp.]